MIKNYFKIAWRTLIKNRTSSFINISGLTVGMAVAMVIGLWIWDELSFDQYHRHYDRIALVMVRESIDGNTSTSTAIPWPLDAEMRKNYGSNFKHIVMMSWTEKHVLSIGDKKIAYPGTFMGDEGPEMFSLAMLKGSTRALQDPSSIVISKSVAEALFGNADPMGKTIKLDNKATFFVSGVYKDLPRNTTLHDIAFIVPWNFYANARDWIGRDPSNWSDYSLFMYVQIADNTDMPKVSGKIKNVILNNLNPGESKARPAVFLEPMSNWHLYSAFKNGVNVGGAIEYIWLFGIIGAFVLLLACINFMNLSTARSEKRAKEVGIRKAVGSLRGQLVSQFFCESVLVAFLAFGLSMLVVSLVIPLFNEMADKKMTILWESPFFWIISISFTLITGMVAGSYPALYLSSFNPVKVLKGAFKSGRFAAIPRKVLVVIQFTVSVILIIGTIVVFKQIQFAKNRPVGYSRDNLINIETTNDDLKNNFTAFRSDLQKSGAVVDVAGSSSPTTGINYSRSDISWNGKDPTRTVDFGNIHVTTEYGRTVGWQFVEGRDFSTQFVSDSLGVILNEAAVRYMGLKNAVGETIKVGRRNLVVIGVIKNMVMGSPYEPAMQTVYLLGRGVDDVIIKIKTGQSSREAIDKIGAVCKIYSPSVPFSYTFVDEEYSKKFAGEERIGKLASVFALLAIFISCLGLFGMAAYVAEQRTKEIGVRKILGASVFNLWQLMSKDFVILVLFSLTISIPFAYYFLHAWLQSYEYRTDLSWWIFAAAGITALFITVLTVSIQTIQAAIANPVKSLRTD